MNDPTYPTKDRGGDSSSHAAAVAFVEAVVARYNEQIRAERRAPTAAGRLAELTSALRACLADQEALEGAAPTDRARIVAACRARLEELDSRGR